MNQVHVNTAKSYAVTIGSGILHTLGKTVREMTKAEKVCIVSDSNVWPLYGNSVCRDLADAGLEVCSFQFPAGENSKNAQTYLELLNFLAKNGLGRNDCLIPLGGGVVGDLAGFAAATYLRGIPYIQVPTTLLSMVDSSVGGKTAIDLPAGKNLCGAFYQPAAVICDTDTLSTLPKEIFRDGCAEVIKYAVLFDPELFCALERTGLEFDRESVITRCICHKRDVVACDEFDNGKRMLLNLGHTIGHAVESCSGYTISHGKAVAAGMAMVSRAANCPDAARITSLLRQFGLPVTTHFSAEDLFARACSDKKRTGGTVNLIIPKAIGNCVIEPTPMEHLKTLIEEGL